MDTTGGQWIVTMPHWLFDRSTVIALAVLGGVFSIITSVCLSKGWITEQQAKLLNKAAYACMGVSMFLFVGAGLLGAGGTPG